MFLSLRRATVLSAFSLLALTACGCGDAAAPASNSPTPEVATSSTATSQQASTVPSPSPALTPSSASASTAPAASFSPSVESPPSPELTPEPTTAMAMPAGTNCGPSSTGASILVLAEVSTSCEEVQQTFLAFNQQFTGSTDPIAVGDYACRSHSSLESQAFGRTVSCQGKGNRLEAMTAYHVGGIPLGDHKPYMQFSYTGHASLGAQAHGVSCTFGEGTHMSCVDWDGGGNTNKVLYSQPGQPFTVDTSKDHPATTSVAELPVGASLNTAAGSCLNDGTYLVCSNGVESFKFRNGELIYP